MGRYLKGTYLGRDTDESRSSKHPDGRYYKIPMTIDGKDIMAYVVVQYEARYDGSNENAPTIRTVSWYDLDDSEFGYEFKRRGYDKLCSESNEKLKFEHAQVEQEKILDILDLQVPIPYDYVPDPNQTQFAQNYRVMIARINSELFEMKKKLIISSRKEHFLMRLEELEENIPSLRLENVMNYFDDSERKYALSLYDRMIFCIMKGKYSFNDYRVFMRNLPNIVRGQGILVSDNQVEQIMKQNNERTTTTFVIPTDRIIAGRCPNQWEVQTVRAHNKAKEKIIDINYSSDDLVYYPLSKNSNNRHAIQVGGVEEAIGSIGRFAICKRFDGEITFVPGKRRARHFKLREYASR